MKTVLYPIRFFLIALLLNSNIIAQTSRFNLEDYKSFLQTNQNISSERLLSMHPAGVFVSNIHQNFSSALYSDSIDAKYNLTDFEKSLIQQNGFMVSERLSGLSMGKAFLDIFQNDLPVFVSTDAILQALHKSYDRILKDVELEIIINKLTELLLKLHSQFPVIAAKYSNQVEMNQMLRDVDVYVTVPLKLLNQQVNPYYPENENKTSEVLNKIYSETGSDSYSLFSNVPVVYDWSQFKPRGHYVDRGYPVLEKYFRAMMWLGRIEIYLLPPRSYTPADSVQIYKDVRRQTVDAMLLSELYENANANQEYEVIEDLLKFFVGEPDNVTLSNIQLLKNAVAINNANELLDSLKLVEFQDTLKKQSFAYQLILSQILIHDPLKPDSIIPASALLLFGQRFVIDSYINSQVVYDKTKRCRLFPSSLDPLFVLGNNAAAQLLEKELQQYEYSENLAALRYLVDSYEQDFWQGSIYNVWVNTIRKLNPPEDRNNLPSLMKTAAFWQQKLNTQLSAWTQLRHDNLLYAKQSYTGGTKCSFPCSYVEPFPKFYAGLKQLAEMAVNKFSNYNPSQSYLISNIVDYFSYFGKISDTLSVIAQKELDNINLNQDEIDFLKKMVYNKTAGSGEKPYDGWYPNLYYNDRYYISGGFLDQDYLVADIHTIPTDCFGNTMGWVQHVGTGPVNLGVFVAALPGGQQTAFIGPMLSYNEYTTTNFYRLADQEWEDKYLMSSLRPSWTNIYLADNEGNSKGEGLKLITSIEENNQDNGVVPEKFIYADIYPNPTNPFNPTVTISFTMPSKLSGVKVELNIYNIQGKLIKNLVSQNLPSGKYLYRWNGKNEYGVDVASGVYISNLRIAGQQYSHKLIMMK